MKKSDLLTIFVGTLLCFGSSIYYTQHRCSVLEKELTLLEKKTQLDYLENKGLCVHNKLLTTKVVIDFLSDKLSQSEKELLSEVYYRLISIDESFEKDGDEAAQEYAREKGVLKDDVVKGRYL